MRNKRYIPNTYDLNKIDINISKQQILSQIQLKENIFNIKFPHSTTKRVDSLGKTKTDTSFYTGTGGNIYLTWRQYLFHNRSGNYLKKFKEALFTNLNIINSNRKNDFSNSFFFGDSGVYLFGCIFGIETKNKSDFLNYFNKLLELKGLNDKKDIEYELLYGITGYLYSLLFLKKYLLSLGGTEFTEENKVLDKVIEDTFYCIIKNGIDYMIKCKWNQCLLFPFPAHERDGSFYLGAAHGLIGIIYILLSTVKLFPNLLKSNNIPSFIKKYNNNLPELLIKNINYIKCLQIESSGNFPDDVEGQDEGDKVHFCHGCIGAVHLFLLAEEIFPGNKYKEVAIKCNKCIWEKGLLYKGNGVCHGMSGTTYALIKLFKETNDIVFLKEALGVALATFDKNVQDKVKEYFDPQRKAKGIPDTPYSLMEGDGGLLIMYYDLIGIINGDKNEFIGKFPGYEI